MHFLIPGFSCPVEPFSSSEAVKSGIGRSFIHYKFIRYFVITNNIVKHGYYSKLTLFKHLSKSHQGLYPYNPARSQQFINDLLFHIIIVRLSGESYLPTVWDLSPMIFPIRYRDAFESSSTEANIMSFYDRSKHIDYIGET